MADNEIQLRMTVMNMAISSKEWDTDPEQVVARAAKYLAFLKGQKSPAAKTVVRRRK